METISPFSFHTLSTHFHLTTLSIENVVAVTALIVALLGSLLYLRNKLSGPTNLLHKRLPHLPGPVVGDELFNKVMETRHHGMVEVHQKYGGLVQLPTINGPVAYVGDANLLNHVFGKPRIFQKTKGTFNGIDGQVDVSNLVQPMYQNTFFEWEGKQWALARKDTNPFFAHPFVAEITCRVTQRFMDTWGAEHECDFLEESHNIVKHAVIDLLSGYKLDPESEKELHDIIKHFVDRNLTEASLTAPTLDSNDAAIFSRCTVFAGRVLNWNKEKIAQEASAAKAGVSDQQDYAETCATPDTNDGNKVHPNGLVYLMLKSGNYTDTEIINIFINLVVAGGETPALAACKTLAAMARDRSIIEKAQQEVDKNTPVDRPINANDLSNLPYLEQCILEGLRRYAPATVVGRLVGEDTELLGQPLLKGTQLQVSIHAVQMDPKIWSDPEIYDPSRFEEDADKHKFGLIAFGAGSRSCPGKAAYIRMTKAMIATIISKYDVATQSSQDDMDAFLPNRWVGWNTSGIHFTFQERTTTHTSEDQPQDGEEEFEFDHHFEAEYDRDRKPTIGMVLLQSDETLEQDIRRLFNCDNFIHFTRVPSETQVVTDNLMAMADHMELASNLFPVRANFKVLAYCCTSASSVMGPERVEAIMRSGCSAPVNTVTDPLSAVTEACLALGVTRIGLVSPYVTELTKILQNSLTRRGIDVINFGSFEEEEEFLVARISQESVRDAAIALARDSEERNSGMEAILLACTNLQTLDIIASVEAATNIPCISSNLCLAWHMARCAGEGTTLDMKQVGSSRLLETGYSPRVEE